MNNAKKYAKLTKYAKRHIKDISKFAYSITNSRDFMDALDEFGCEDDYMDFDYWHCYKEKIDLNFYGSEDGMELLCTAYPVFEYLADFSSEYAISIPLEQR